MRGYAKSISASAIMAECLALEGVSAGYGATVVLEDIAVRLDAGATLSILGRNGVGKSTLLATTLGHTTLHSGRILFEGKPIEKMKTFERARLGIGYVPQEREIFPSLSVDENLNIAVRTNGTRAAWTKERVFELFPQLAARRANMGNQLSGGEQQMLAIARALVGNPTLLLMDEPLEGLAPVIIDTLIAAFNRLRQDEGLAIVLVEQHARIALDFAPRTLILDRGRIVYDGASRPLIDDAQKLADLIGVGG